ncbi:hypothetical protein B0H16DRAFT_1332721, partial [Mycena metata]
PRNSMVPVEAELCTRSAGESAAILFAVQNLPREMAINFQLKSRRTIQALITKLSSYADGDWVEVEDGHLLRAITAALRGRGTKCTFKEAGISNCDSMAMALALSREGLNEEIPTHLQVDIPRGYVMKGMKLKTGSQRTFYRAVKAMKPKPQHMKTTIMLDITRHAAWNLSGATPTDGQIWRSIRHQDITRTTRDFLWRCLHQAYKVGEHWRNIPTYEHYANCQVDEPMEHILLECDAPGREVLWNLAQELWEKKGYAWPEMNYGSVFACGLVDETAHLIWKFRCTT